MLNRRTPLDSDPSAGIPGFSASSFQASLDELTQAIRELAEALDATAKVPTPSTRMSTPTATAALAPKRRPGRPTNAERAARLAVLQEAGVPTSVIEASRYASTPAPKPVSYEDARQAIIRLGTRQGRPAAIAVLASFGCDHLDDLKPQQFSDVLAACARALGE